MAVKKNKSVIKAILMISQIGISMIVPIFLGAFIGYRLDQWLGTGFLFLAFLVLGISAAFRNIYILTKPFYAEDLKREQEEQAYWDSLRSGRKEKEGPEAEWAEAGRDGAAGGPDGIAARRERERKQLAEGLGQISGGEEKDPMQEIEEEFNAWRKRNGR